MAHLDPRLAGCLDASDVVQEALAEAAEQLTNYIENRPLPLSKSSVKSEVFTTLPSCDEIPGEIFDKLARRLEAGEQIDAAELARVFTT